MKNNFAVTLFSIVAIAFCAAIVVHILIRKNKVHNTRTEGNYIIGSAARSVGDTLHTSGYVYDNGLNITWHEPIEFESMKRFLTHIEDAMSTNSLDTLRSELGLPERFSVTFVLPKQATTEE